MRIFDFDPNLRWLFCMTHPDDEISICAWILRLTKSGHEVFISWTHHTPARHVEACRAAALLGVPEEKLFFHHGKDGLICEQIPELQPAFASMIEQIEPDRVCCGAFEQGHLDHDATNLLVNGAFKGPVFEIPFYHTYLTRRPIVNRFADPAGEEVLLLRNEEQKFKVDFAKQFPSQAIFRNLVLNEMRRKMVARKDGPLKATERMRQQTHKHFLTPNLPEPLASKVRSCAKWHRWEKAVQAIL